MEKQYRMLRVLEYVGTREFIDDCIKLRGVKGSSPKGWSWDLGHITEAFIGELPTELDEYGLHNEALPIGVFDTQEHEPGKIFFKEETNGNTAKDEPVYTAQRGDFR